MDEPIEIFQININQLIGKLHLAGQQQIPNTVVLNTGIVNPVAKADPANPGDVKFSTSSKDGRYEVAFSRKLVYQPEIDVKNNPKYQEAEKLKEKQNKENGSKKLLDKGKEKDDKEKEKLKKMYIDIFKSYSLSGFKEDAKDFDATRKSFQEALQKENEKRKSDLDKKTVQLKSELVADVEKYFESFMGKDAASDARADAEKQDLSAISADGSISDPTKFDYKKYVKDFVFDKQKLANDIEEKQKKIDQQNVKEAAKDVGLFVVFEVTTTE